MDNLIALNLIESLEGEINNVDSIKCTGISAVLAVLSPEDAQWCNEKIARYVELTSEFVKVDTNDKSWSQLKYERNQFIHLWKTDLTHKLYSKLNTQEATVI